MSLTLSSAHVHTTFCDGKTPAPDMARTAYEKGFVSLGFSSHAPQDFPFVAPHHFGNLQRGIGLRALCIRR